MTDRGLYTVSTTNKQINKHYNYDEVMHALLNYILLIITYYNNTLTGKTVISSAR